MVKYGDVGATRKQKKTKRRFIYEAESDTRVFGVCEEADYLLLGLLK